MTARPWVMTQPQDGEGLRLETPRGREQLTYLEHPFCCTGVRKDELLVFEPLQVLLTVAVLLTLITILLLLLGLPSLPTTLKMNFS